MTRNREGRTALSLPLPALAAVVCTHPFSARAVRVAVPLYLHGRKFVRLKRLSAGADGHRPRHLAMSPVRPPASTVGEPGIFANVTHDRTVARSQSYAQGRLP